MQVWWWWDSWRETEGGTLFGNCRLDHTSLLLGNHSQSRRPNSDRLLKFLQPFTPCQNLPQCWLWLEGGFLIFLDSSNKLIGWDVGRQMTEDWRCCIGITCTLRIVHSDGSRRFGWIEKMQQDREDVGRSDFLQLTAFAVLTRVGIADDAKATESFLQRNHLLTKFIDPGRECRKNCRYCKFGLIY